MVELKKKEPTSPQSIDDLDAGWDAEDDEAPDLEEASEEEEPEPAGLTPAERVQRAEANKERARGKALAKLAKKERRKARALAATAKKKAKQPKVGRKKPAASERSAPSLRGVTSDLPESNEPDEAAKRTSESSALRRPTAAGRGGSKWQTLTTIAVLAALAGGVAFFFLRK